MKVLKKALTVLLVIVVILTVIFLAGRYGWKLNGFSACQGAGIQSVEVTDKAVHITGFLPQSEQYGVYVKLERNDVYSVSMSYEGVGGGVSHADSTAMESGEYFFMDNDIMIASKEADAPVPFTITAKAADESVVATGEFFFDANVERMFLNVTADGSIIEEKY